MSAALLNHSRMPEENHIRGMPRARMPSQRGSARRFSAAIQVSAPPAPHRLPARPFALPPACAVAQSPARERHALQQQPRYVTVRLSAMFVVEAEAGVAYACRPL